MWRKKWSIFYNDNFDHFDEKFRNLFKELNQLNWTFPQLKNLGHFFLSSTSSLFNIFSPQHLSSTYTSLSSTSSPTTRKIHKLIQEHVLLFFNFFPPEIWVEPAKCTINFGRQLKANKQNSFMGCFNII